MDKNIEKTVEDIRAKYNVFEEENTDGGEGSGNWGHVGRPGEWGGSMPGGGNAFRLTNSSKKGQKGYFSSQAKLRNEAKAELNAAKKSGNKAKQKMAEARVKRLNMEQKSYHKIKNLNKNASRDILSDVFGKGKTTVSPANKNMYGTAEGIQETYIKNTKLSKKK